MVSVALLSGQAPAASPYCLRSHQAADAGQAGVPTRAEAQLQEQEQPAGAIAGISKPHSPADAPGRKYGCSKCRWTVKGCAKCRPEVAPPLSSAMAFVQHACMRVRHPCMCPCGACPMRCVSQTSCEKVHSSVAWAWCWVKYMPCGRSRQACNLRPFVVEGFGIQGSIALLIIYLLMLSCAGCAGHARVA